MKKIISLLIVCLTACCAMAEGKFLQLSLTPDIALEPRPATINGISLNIWGENEQSALTLGFINGSTGESAGLSLGLVNYAESYRGVHFGFLNVSTDHFTGVQWGAVNIGNRVSGLQCGTVNYADKLKGVQLGLINIAASSGWFDNLPDQLCKICIFVNWSF